MAWGGDADLRGMRLAGFPADSGMLQGRSKPTKFASEAVVQNPRTLFQSEK
jgi:hypothetical protein